MDYESAPEKRRSIGASIGNGLAVAFVVVGIGFVAVTYGVLTPYGYWVGTPAKAKVGDCKLHDAPGEGGGTDLNCNGTWSVRGQSQAGPIKPSFNGDEQNEVTAGKSVLDVRVHDGVAYTSHSVGRTFYLALALGAGLVIWGSFRLRRAWNARR